MGEFWYSRYHKNKTECQYFIVGKRDRQIFFSTIEKEVEIETIIYSPQRQAQ